MVKKSERNTELKNIGYELFVGALSILAVVNLVLGFVVRDLNLEQVLELIDAVLTVIFLGDFLYRLLTAGSKSGYFLRQYGWADLLASLPVAQLKLFRLFRIWRVVRLARAVGARNLGHQFIDGLAQNALLTVVFLSILLLEFGSVAILAAERSSPYANITTAGDAMWWDYVTITTVGYGDYYPVTPSGRLIGILLMTAGVGLFGTLSGFLANTFLSPRKRRPDEIIADSDDPKTRIEEITRMLEAQEEAMADLKSKLQALQELV